MKRSGIREAIINIGSTPHCASGGRGQTGTSDCALNGIAIERNRAMPL